VEHTAPSPPERLAVGLCTVTFRQLAASAVVELAASAAVEVLEWGGDVHVPEGDERAARAAAALSADHGLGIASYGSYLVLDAQPGRRLDAVLDTALELGAPAVRVWCPPVVDAPGGPAPGDGSDGDGAVAWSTLVDAAAHTVDAARDVGLAVYLEFHGGGATASAATVVDLLEQVPGLWTGWQPPYWAPRSAAEELADLGALAGRLLHVDVYEWDVDGTRHPLAGRRLQWSARLAAAGVATGSARAAGLRPAALIEFVPGDDPAALVGEVSELSAVLAG
jgi:3-dehydroshikimate dehydratase